MDWIFENPWIIGVVAIASVVIYGLIRRQTGRKRNAQSRCARCGKMLDPESTYKVDIDGDNDTRFLMCPTCGKTVLRVYRLAYRLFLVAFIAGILYATGSVVFNIATNHKFTLGDAEPILWFALSCLALLGIVHSAMKNSSSNVSDK